MKTKRIKLFYLAIFVSLFYISCDDNDDYYVNPKPVATDIKIISCMEINDVNPLNNLSFTLEKTGRPLFDMVILFSSNINYSDSLGRPYIHHNTEMTNILANTNKYLKPLKDKGIKVVLSLLGNWDRAGVANMADTTAQKYANEIKYTLDKYNLDGVMFDDEYTNYSDTPYPGFVKQSPQAAGRLLYETKKAIGKKLVLSYVHNNLNDKLPTIEGLAPASYIDYALSDYLRDPVSSYLYTDMLNRQKAPWSQEFNLGAFLSQYGDFYNTSYEFILKEGYGAHMIFGLNPFNGNFMTDQLPELTKMSEAFFNDTIIYDGKIYPTDYK